MSTIGDVLKAVREVLLLQSQVEQLDEQIEVQESRLSKLSDQMNDIDKRLYALERIIDLGARQSGQKRIDDQ
jgi:chaperonin cofactor prefoldin